MFSETRIKVGYAECGYSNIAHHSNYGRWYEIALFDLVEKNGYSYTDLLGKGYFLPILDISTRFLLPIYGGDAITVRLSILELGHVKLACSYELIRDSDGALLASGITTHAFADSKLKPLNLPKKLPDLYEQLRRYLV